MAQFNPAKKSDKSRQKGPKKARKKVKKKVSEKSKEQAQLRADELKQLALLKRIKATLRKGKTADDTAAPNSDLKALSQKISRTLAELQDDPSHDSSADTASVDAKSRVEEQGTVAPKKAVVAHRISAEQAMRNRQLNSSAQEEQVPVQDEGPPVSKLAWGEVVELAADEASHSDSDTSSGDLSSASAGRREEKGVNRDHRETKLDDSMARPRGTKTSKRGTKHKTKRAAFKLPKLGRIKLPGLASLVHNGKTSYVERKLSAIQKKLEKHGLLKPGRDLLTLLSKPNVAIHFFIERGDATSIKNALFLLKIGTNPSGRDQHNRSILHVAAATGDTAVMAEALDSGVARHSVDTDGDTALITAAYNRNTSAMTLLLADQGPEQLLHKNTDGDSVFHVMGNTLKGSIEDFVQKLRGNTAVLRHRNRDRDSVLDIVARQPDSKHALQSLVSTGIFRRSDIQRAYDSIKDQADDFKLKLYRNRDYLQSLLK